MGKFNEAQNFLISNKKKAIKAAVFTAHPDDETIWMGGTLILTGCCPNRDLSTTLPCDKIDELLI